MLVPSRLAPWLRRAFPSAVLPLGLSVPLVAIRGPDSGERCGTLSLSFSEHDSMLKVEVFGGGEEVHGWAGLSRVLFVILKMLSSSSLVCHASRYFLPTEELFDEPLRPQQFA